MSMASVMLTSSPTSRVGTGDGQARRHALLDVVGDVAAAVGLAEVECEQPDRLAEKRWFAVALSQPSASLFHSRGLS